MFPNLHRNQQWAFVDGVLCGALITYAVVRANKINRAKKALEKAYASETGFKYVEHR